MSIGNTLPTPIIDLGLLKGNRLWVKREDLMPFSFGGNKARKAQLFFQEIDRGACDSVVTYGSSSSNHCRVIANECCRRGIKCHIVSPAEASAATFNSQMIELFGATTTITPVSLVHETLEIKLEELLNSGKRPYFIEGGGHGNIGTEAYVRCYREIKEYENENEVFFDYIFFASGTGTTHAGLVCGQILAADERRIIGISIARKNPRGREVVLQSIRDYLDGKTVESEIQKRTIFIDKYTSGYGCHDEDVKETIIYVLRKYGIPLDMTYTGKAFTGMSDYLSAEKGKNVLFIHTGGTPLFFDSLRSAKV